MGIKDSAMSRPERIGRYVITLLGAALGEHGQDNAQGDHATQNPAGRGAYATIKATAKLQEKGSDNGWVLPSATR